jgi:TRAP-type C4-dicarboxylate transport system permease small subunit
VRPTMFSRLHPPFSHIMITKMLNNFDRSVTRFVKATVWIPYVAIVAMALLLITNIFRRALFGLVITGTVEIVELFLVVAVFFAIAYTSACGGHIVIDLISAKFKGATRAAARSLAFLVGFAIYGLISWQTAVHAWENLNSVSPLSTTMLHVSLTPFIFVASVGSLLLCLHQLGSFVRSVSTFRKSAAATTGAEAKGDNVY